MEELTPELKKEFETQIEKCFPVGFPGTGWHQLPLDERDDFINTLFAAYQMGLKADRWIPISKYPKSNPVVQRWHRIYKYPVSVYLKIGASTVEGCDWVTGTLDHTWPELAFEPFFQPLPKAPKL